MKGSILNGMKESVSINGVFCPRMPKNNRLELRGLLNRKVVLHCESTKDDFNETKGSLIVV